MIKIALLFLLTSQLTANADADLQIYALGRSYPLSATLNVNAGYGLTLWGTADGSPWYGYIRPYIEGSTAGTYNSGTVGLEVFPIAILGASAGSEWIGNSAKYKAYDCVTYNCVGHFQNTFAQAQLVLGAGPFFLVGRGRIENWKQKELNSLDFIEPTAGLQAKSTGDRVKSLMGLLGWNLSDSMRVSYLGQYAEMVEYRGFSRAHYLILRWTDGPWSIVGGAGAFGSTLKAWEPSALLRLSWTPAPSIALF